MTELMKAARLHERGAKLRIDTVEIPRIGPHDALVQVIAAGVIPNMATVFGAHYWNHLPPLPAIMGLDAAGVIFEVGAAVTGFRKDDRVYIHPRLTCGTCHYCRTGEAMLCASAALRGFMSGTPEGAKLLGENPWGAFAEYSASAERYLVKLPDVVTFEQAARFLYLGTAFSALRVGGTGAGTWIGISGITGTLGVAAVLWATAMGATRILGWGRNREVLAEVKAMAPHRVETLALGDEPILPWVRARTEGLGVDLLLDCIGRGGPASLSQEGITALKRGGSAVNIGALNEPMAIDPRGFMNRQLCYCGSSGFSLAEAEQMMELARAHAVDLGVLITRRFALDQVNEAIAEAATRPGGFTNIVVAPQE